MLLEKGSLVQDDYDVSPILLHCLEQIHIQLVFTLNQELLITLGAGWDNSLLSKDVFVGLNKWLAPLSVLICQPE